MYIDGNWLTCPDCETAWKQGQGKTCYECGEPGVSMLIEDMNDGTDTDPRD